jgi:peroxiredoxin
LKNFLRSFFISFFLLIILTLSLYALMMLLQGKPPALSWLGLALAAGTPMTFFARVLFSPRSVAVDQPLGTTALTGLGLAITMAVSWRYGDAAGMTHAWAGICLIGWVIYLRWYSTFDREQIMERLKGKSLPAFELEDLEGNSKHSSELSGSPHILMFIRGNWCPFCTAQVADLAAQYRQLSQWGVIVWVISSQPQNHNRKLAKRFDVPIEFLRDKNNQAARSLGIVAPWGIPLGTQLLGYSSETAMPTVIITDKNEKVLWAHETDNYRLRPDPETFLPIVEAQAKVG